MQTTATIIIENLTAGTDAGGATTNVAVDAGAFDGTRHGTFDTLQANASTDSIGVLGNFH